MRTCAPAVEIAPVRVNNRVAKTPLLMPLMPAADRQALDQQTAQKFASHVGERRRKKLRLIVPNVRSTYSTGQGLIAEARMAGAVPADRSRVTPRGADRSSCGSMLVSSAGDGVGQCSLKMSMPSLTSALLAVSGARKRIQTSPEVLEIGAGAGSGRGRSRI